MKTRLECPLRIATIIGVLLVFQASAAQAQLQNRSFEDPDDTNRWVSTSAAGWTLFGEWMRRETGWSPRHYGPCMIGYHHWRLTDRSKAGFHQDVRDVPAGRSVTFKIFVSKDKGTNASFIELRLEPAGGGSPLGSRRMEMKDIPDNQWTELSVSGRAGLHGGVRVCVTVQPAGQGSFCGSLKFDDAAVEVAGGKT